MQALVGAPVTRAEVSRIPARRRFKNRMAIYPGGHAQWASPDKCTCRWNTDCPAPGPRLRPSDIPARCCADADLRGGQVTAPDNFGIARLGLFQSREMPFGNDQTCVGALDQCLRMRIRVRPRELSWTGISPRMIRQKRQLGSLVMKPPGGTIPSRSAACQPLGCSVASPGAPGTLRLLRSSSPRPVFERALDRHREPERESTSRLQDLRSAAPSQCDSGA